AELVEVQLASEKYPASRISGFLVIRHGDDNPHGDRLGERATATHSSAALRAAGLARLCRHRDGRLAAMLQQVVHPLVSARTGGGGLLAGGGVQGCAGPGREAVCGCLRSEHATERDPGARW